MKSSNNKEALIASKAEKKLSFFQIFTQLANKNQKRLIIFLCLLFSSSAAMVLGIPIVFKEPIIICLPENTQCSEEQACFQDFYIDLQNGPSSFTAEFGLVCENKPQKTFAITLSFFGILLGCICTTFIPVNQRKRKTYLGILGIVMGLSLWSMRFSETYFLGISVEISICTFCFMSINTFSYLFIGENFKGELAGFLTIMYSACWAFTGIFYALFAYLINADWKIFVMATGTMGIFSSFGLLLTKNDAIYEEGNEEAEEVNIIFC